MNFQATNIPNIFSYATSELSQDAIICWLLAWADPKYATTDPALHQCGTEMLKAMFQLCGKNMPTIHNVNIKQQFEKIDVLCVVNDSYPIIIEDKTDTHDHSGQLNRYFEIIKNLPSNSGEKKYSHENILKLYFKTGDQSSYLGVKKYGYYPFLRDDFLNVINTYDGENQILRDYRIHLQKISDAVNNFKTKPLEKWSGKSWAGFFMALQNSLNMENNDAKHWEYVPNAGGGFMCFWWHEQKDVPCKPKLQLEESKLCFKICMEDKLLQKKSRLAWHKAVQAAAVELKQGMVEPERFGIGKHMTVSILKADYRQVNTEGLIDMDATILELKKMEKLLDLAVEKYAAL
jgi:hypothetical protein